MMDAITYNAQRPYTAANWAEIQVAVGAAPDGQPGPETARRVKRAQQRTDQPADGKAGRKTLKRLGLDTRRIFSVEAAIARHPGRQLGLDVAWRQKVIDWEAVAGAGVRFAYLRTGQHETWTDSTFDQNRVGCRAVGMPWGAYHVAQIYREDADFWTNPEREAENLLRKLGGLERGQLPPALDLETGFLREVRKHRSAAWASDWIEMFLDVSETEGLEPVLYVSRNGQRYLEPRPRLIKASRWLVDYAARDACWPGDPEQADGWASGPDSWDVRQVSEEMYCPGIATKVDLDIARSGYL